MRAANTLTLERGLDGWTMEELAQACELSRRTLFNYFPHKLDAVLGPVPEFPPEALEVFRAKGPTGSLMEDSRLLARRILEVEEVDRRDLRLHRDVIVAHPGLLLAVHERFEQLATALTDHVLAREGEEFGAERARMLVRLMVALFDTCFTGLATDPQGRPLADLFDEALDTARELLT